MRSIGLIGALVIAAPLAAQSNKFRTDDVLTTARNRTEASPAAARDAQNSRRNAKVPPGQLPPAGMCRIWIDGVPPGQQPAPTDCQTAVATKPANARILWGDQSAFPGKGKGKSNASASRSIAKSANDRSGSSHGRHKGDD